MLWRGAKPGQSCSSDVHTSFTIPHLQVADFGLARSLEVGLEVMTKNSGTLTHLPPETLTKGIVSPATDVRGGGGKGGEGGATDVRGGGGGAGGGGPGSGGHA